MNTLRYFEADFDSLHIDIRELYLLMGYGLQTPNQNTLDLIDQILEEIADICHPYYGYLLSEGNRISKEEIDVAGTVLRPGVLITSSLRKSEFYAVFTATIGAKFDRWLEEVKQSDDIVKLFIGNSIGSILAESVVAKLVEQLEKDVSEEGLKITNNYSPGYCDWELTEQQKIFSLLPSEVSKITLTDSCLMLPIKSVSGIIGVGKDVKKRAYSCDICTMTNCIKNIKNQKKRKNY